MAYKDLRVYLDHLESIGKLRRISKLVDKDWELACLVRWMYQAVPEAERYAMLFENVKGFDIPFVTAAVGGSRQIYAEAMETEPENIYDKWIKSMQQPIDKREVPRSEAPVKENIISGDDVDMKMLPAAVWTPGKDAGPYLTSNCVVTIDPNSGLHNVGNYRIQLQSSRRIGIQIFANQHVGMHFHEWRKRGERMPIAVAIGVDPSLSVTATAKVPRDQEEYAVSGAIRGEPFPVIKAELSDIMVPANAEFVIEGYVPLDEEPMEGPFGEYFGYMGLPGPKRCIDVELISHRNKPIYQAFVSQMPPSESLVVQQEPFGAIVLKHLKYDLGIPGIKDVYFTDASAKAHLIISMKPQYPAHARKTMVIAANLLDANSAKWVTVVDDDIDIRDPYMVEWAIASRIDPATDVIILPDMETTILDPATTLDIQPDKTSLNLRERLTGAKLLLDATIGKTYPSISLPTKELMYKALEGWDETGLPPIEVPKRTAMLLDAHPSGDIYFEPFQ